MKENGKVIQKRMAMSRSHMAKERERKSKENYAYILAEERMAEQEEIRKRHERQKEVEEYRKEMKEKEELTKEIMILRNIYNQKNNDFKKYAMEHCNCMEHCKDKNSFAIILSSYDIKLEELHLQLKFIDEKIKVKSKTIKLY